MKTEIEVKYMPDTANTGEIKLTFVCAGCGHDVKVTDVADFIEVAPCQTCQEKAYGQGRIDK